MQKRLICNAFIIITCVSLLLIGCKEAEGTTPEASSSEVVSEVESEVISEEVSEDASEEVVSEEVEEEVSEMPEIVDGVQVVYYDTYEEFINFIDNTLGSTVISLTCFNYPEKGQWILYNGAHCTLEENFSMTIESPKTITNITSEKGSVLVVDYEYEGRYVWDIGLYEEGTDIEVPLVITYEDGTEENFTVYITKDWKYPWEE